MGNSHVKLLLGIDAGHWRAKNPYFSEVTLNQSMKSALTLIKGKGFLAGFSPRTAADYTNRISEEVKAFKPDAPDFEKLSFIFDLVQAWGGLTGRRPYVKRGGQPESSRQCFADWKQHYLSGVRSALNGDPVPALKAWQHIYGVGASFAPKHLMFWSGTYPVLDSRISVLLCGSKRLLQSPEGYREFLGLVQPLCDHFNFSLLEVEKALFAFSQNFFQNDMLVFKKGDLPDKTDVEIAQELVSVGKSPFGPY